MECHAEFEVAPHLSEDHSQLKDSLHTYLDDPVELAVVIVPTASLRVTREHSTWYTSPPGWL